MSNRLLLLIAFPVAIIISYYVGTRVGSNTRVSYKIDAKRVSTDKTGQRFIYSPLIDTACMPYHSMNEAGFDELIKSQGKLDTVYIGSSGKMLQLWGGCKRLFICGHSDKIVWDTTLITYKH